MIYQITMTLSNNKKVMIQREYDYSIDYVKKHIIKQLLNVTWFEDRDKYINLSNVLMVEVSQVNDYVAGDYVINTMSKDERRDFILNNLRKSFEE